MGDGIYNKDGDRGGIPCGFFGAAATGLCVGGRTGVNIAVIRTRFRSASNAAVLRH